jgi:adenylosuccinate lyase
MISRFARPEMAELWTDQRRYAGWVRVEVLASEAQAQLGNVPEAALSDIRSARVPAAARVAEL